MRDKKFDLLMYSGGCCKIGDLTKQEMPVDLKYPNFDELSITIISKGLALYEHTLEDVKIITTNIYKDSQGEKKGDAYHKQTIADEGTVSDFRVCLNCIKYASDNGINLYDED